MIRPPTEEPPATGESTIEAELPQALLEDIAAMQAPVVEAANVPQATEEAEELSLEQKILNQFQNPKHLSDLNLGDQFLSHIVPLLKQLVAGAEKHHLQGDQLASVKKMIEEIENMLHSNAVGSDAPPRFFSPGHNKGSIIRAFEKFLATDYIPKHKEVIQAVLKHAQEADNAASAQVDSKAAAEVAPDGVDAPPAQEQKEVIPESRDSSAEPIMPRVDPVIARKAAAQDKAYKKLPLFTTYNQAIDMVASIDQAMEDIKTQYMGADVEEGKEEWKTVESLLGGRAKDRPEPGTRAYKKAEARLEQAKKEYAQRKQDYQHAEREVTKNADKFFYYNEKFGTSVQPKDVVPEAQHAKVTIGGVVKKPRGPAPPARPKSPSPEMEVDLSADVPSGEEGEFAPDADDYEPEFVDPAARAARTWERGKPLQRGVSGSFLLENHTFKAILEEMSKFGAKPKKTYHDVTLALYGRSTAKLDGPLIKYYNAWRENKAQIKDYEFHVKRNQGKEPLPVSKLQRFSDPLEYSPETERKAKVGVHRRGKNQDFSEKDLGKIAKIYNTHPAIVIGQLQHLGKAPYSFGNNLRLKVDLSKIIEKGKY